jgi:phage-related protein
LRYAKSDIYFGPWGFGDKPGEKPIVWLADKIKTPPFSSSGRREVGWLLRRLQRGERLEMPHSRAMPSIGRGCHELRVRDENGDWRVVYRVESTAVVVIGMFRKQTRRTPRNVMETCRARFEEYERRIK